MTETETALHGVPIFFESRSFRDDSYIYELMDPEKSFMVRSDFHESVTRLKEVGIFRSPADSITFSERHLKVESGLGPYYATLRVSGNVFKNEKRSRSETRLFGYISRDVIKNLSLPVDNGRRDQARDTFFVNDLVTMEKNRFAEYDTQLVNGWENMYYLDLVTKWKNSWSESALKRIDEYISLDTSLETIAYLLRNNVGTREMEAFVSLPFSWVKNVFEGEHSLQMTV